MHKHCFPGLVRISKAKARKLWGKRDMSLCPSNLRPGFPWRPNIDVFASEIASKLASEYEHERRQASFDYFVRNFEWYNCNDRETGLYTAFYLIVPAKTTTISVDVKQLDKDIETFKGDKA